MEQAKSWIDGKPVYITLHELVLTVMSGGKLASLPLLRAIMLYLCVYRIFDPLIEQCFPSTAQLVIK